jgi:signal transduction histidine kinase
VVPEPDAVTFEIIDQGPGLSDEDQTKLFKKFTRLTPLPTGGESSNGLGLWIVQRMAQGMHGEVFCRSKLGRGSCFGLRLPAVQAMPEMQAA